MNYLAMDIGCIECGEDSAVIGVYASAAEAQAACDVCEAAGWRGGQHYYEVFDLTQPVGPPPKNGDAA